MKITEKLALSNCSDSPNVTIAFLGDSVTQGCFETYFDGDKSNGDFNCPERAYPQRVKEILSKLYPNAKLNIVNAGVAGNNARMGLERFDSDVSPFKPDLTIVSFGLNDSCSGRDYVSTYLNKLESIFDKVKELGSECIFMTQNMMCTEIYAQMKNKKEIEIAASISKTQNEGTLEYFFDCAKELADKKEVRVCDVYSSWKNMNAGGVNITNLLANHLNHPVFDFHYYFAIKLIEEMFK